MPHMSVPVLVALPAPSISTPMTSPAFAMNPACKLTHARLCLDRRRHLSMQQRSDNLPSATTAACSYPYCKDAVCELAATRPSPLHIAILLWPRVNRKTHYPRRQPPPTILISLMGASLVHVLGYHPEAYVAFFPSLFTYPHCFFPCRCSMMHPSRCISVTSRRWYSWWKQ